MISIDTNALLRLILGDEPIQSERIRRAVNTAKESQIPELILDGVLLETVWVLTSGYGYKRQDIVFLIDTLLSVEYVHFMDRKLIQQVAEKVRQGGDFADMFFALQAQRQGSDKMLSFDKKFCSLFPGFVMEP